MLAKFTARDCYFQITWAAFWIAVCSYIHWWITVTVMLIHGAVFVAILSKIRSIPK
jgi:hypothetical protein